MKYEVWRSGKYWGSIGLVDEDIIVEGEEKYKKVLEAELADIRSKGLLVRSGGFDKGQLVELVTRKKIRKITEADFRQIKDELVRRFYVVVAGKD